MSDPRLEYASPVLSNVADVRFRPAATLLIVASLLSSAVAGVIGLIYVDRLGAAGTLLIASAVLNAVAILGFVSRPQPAFGTGAVLVVLSVAAGIVAFALIHAGHRRLEAEILGSATGGGDVVVYVETARGARLATWRVARIVTVLATTLSAFLGCYLITRRIRIDVARRRNNR